MLITKEQKQVSLESGKRQNVLEEELTFCPAPPPPPSPPPPLPGSHDSSPLLSDFLFEDCTITRKKVRFGIEKNTSEEELTFG